jgi:hypothetical protein
VGEPNERRLTLADRRLVRVPRRRRQGVQAGSFHRRFHHRLHPHTRIHHQVVQLAIVPLALVKAANVFRAPPIGGDDFAFSLFGIEA